MMELVTPMDMNGKENEAVKDEIGKQSCQTVANNTQVTREDARSQYGYSFGENTRSVIGTNDLLIKINSAKQFLLRRHRVKFILTLKGREYTNVDNVKKIFAKISEELKSYGNSETMRQNGNVVSQLFNLKAKRKNES
ncbi:translation initiation factor IF-3 [Plasmodium ovale curtisi]|uniref:Translation initiation factor IF-3 n=1 Tax=Plasmodium ovale curtisi TaxID=864141 RepID=A0A1A8VSQ8_PLAOA|nr:translation initiation factor IF-3 [Plasmodium ovale curtisi]SBS82371.1 translation initiation factor IF-3 [Plasmodium ovale curtisi]